MNDTYRSYKQARDTAWRALLQLPQKSLPVDVEALARQIGVQVMPFPDRREQPQLYAQVSVASDGPCVSLCIRGVWHIFLRDSAWDDAGRRFAIAHELGHLLLAHGQRTLARGVKTFRSRLNAGDLLEEFDNLEDYAADIFAVRLLSPACILHELQVDSAEGIQRLCGLPPKAAALRAQRMEVLNERDAFYGVKLERQVRDAFLPYLQKEMRASAPFIAPAKSAPDRRSVLQAAPIDRKKREAEETPAKADKRLWGLILLGMAAAVAAFFLLKN